MKWWTAACIIVRRCDVERGSRPNLGACNCSLRRACNPVYARHGCETISHHFRSLIEPRLTGRPFLAGYPGS